MNPKYHYMLRGLSVDGDQVCLLSDTRDSDRSPSDFLPTVGLEFSEADVFELKGNVAENGEKWLRDHKGFWRKSKVANA